MNRDISIIIVGGGIGGLVAALQLHADGFKNIDVFEATPELKALGVGINIQPSATLILRNLGLLPALQETAIETASLNFFSRHGKLVFSEPRGVKAGYAVPQFSIHRGMLHHILLSAFKERLGGSRLHMDHEFTSYTQTEELITASFRRRSDRELLPEVPLESGSVLVAADGINSKVRALLYPDEGPPHYSGIMLWRGSSIGKPILNGEDMIWAGWNDCKYITYPIGQQRKQQGESLLNWIAEMRVRPIGDPDRMPPTADWGKRVPKSRFAEHYKDWNFDFLDVPKMIEDAEEAFEYPMCDRDPVDQWSFGRLTLLGDAAHPLYPIGSNGASQAILDAVCLSEELQKHDNVVAALKSYENIRLRLTAKICHANRAGGPDHVLQLAHERCPDGFENIEDVISKTELDEVGRAYKALAGFDMESVNQRARDTDGTAEVKGLKSPVLDHNIIL